jgi:hypothetical protein
MLHQRFRLVVVRRVGALVGVFFFAVDAAGVAVSALAVSTVLGVVLAVTDESRFSTESPASGGASGCRKKTGNRIETGTGRP